MTKIEGLTIFTEEEFARIVDELFNRAESDFTTLLRIVDRAFSRSVEYWANTTSVLKGGLHHEDVMQEIRLKVYKNATTNFFFREGLEGRINYDPLGFQKWLYTVVSHEKISYYNKICKIKNSTLHLDDDGVSLMVDSLVSTSGDHFVELRTKEKLSEAFKIVIESEARPYTVLTWVAARLIFIKTTEKGGEISDLISTVFGDMTLYMMRDILFEATSTIEWMKLTEKGKERINKALDAPYDDVSKYGERRYLDFYMKKGAKASISDWINKMDNIIKKQVAAK